LYPVLLLENDLFRHLFLPVNFPGSSLGVGKIMAFCIKCLKMSALQEINGLHGVSGNLSGRFGNLPDGFGNLSDPFGNHSGFTVNPFG
jgi:hypothetical protein